MATTTADVTDTLITEALTELRGARLDHAHSPNADTALTVAHAEQRLNRLLDQYRKTGKPAQRETAKSR